MRPRPALLLTAALTLPVVALPLATLDAGPGLDASTDVLLAGDSRAEASYERMEEMLDGLAMVAVLVHDGALLSNPGVARIKRLGDALEELPGVGDVKSLTHSWRPVREEGFALDPRELIGLAPMVPLAPVPEAAWERVRAFVTRYPLARDLFVSRDGTWGLVLVTVDRDLGSRGAVDALEAEVRGLLGPFEEAGASVHVLGFPLLEAEVLDAVEADARRFAGWAAALAALVLLVTFRSPTVLVAVLLFLAAGLVSIPVMLRLTGTTLDLYTAMLVPLVAGLQLAMLVHFVSAYLREAAGAGDARGVVAASAPGPVSPSRCAARALSVVGRPSLIAVVTSAAGLLSLCAGDVGLVREFGYVGAGAVLVAAAITFLPLVLLAARGGGARATTGRERPPADATSGVDDRVGSDPVADDRPLDDPTDAPWAARLADAIVRRRRLVGLLALALVAACLPGLAALRTDVRATGFLPHDSPSRGSLTALDEHLGGVNVFHLELRCDVPGGAAAPETLGFLQELTAFAESRPGVTNVYSYALLLGLVNQVWTGDTSGEPTPPDSPLLAAAFTAGLRTLDWALLDSFLDASDTTTSVLVRTRDMPGPRYLALLDELTTFAEARCPEGVTLDVQRGVHDLLEADRRIVDSQLDSLALCVVAVLLVVGLLSWSWRAAVVVLLVNVPALAVVVGLMGALDLPLNSITVMVSAVVLGIAVDDSIHWVGFHRQEVARGAGAAAVRRTLEHKLVPMACTTGILVAALSVLALSSFPPVADFGLLSSAALTTSLASAVFVLPALVGRRVSPGSPGRPRT